MPFSSAAKNESKKYIVSLKSGADLKRAENVIASIDGVEIEYKYDTLHKGFSIAASETEIEKIKALFDVKTVEQAQMYQLFEEETADAVEDTFLPILMNRKLKPPSSSG